MSSDPFVTRRQAEVHWNVSRSTLLRAEKAGLVAHRQGKGEVRYARHDIETLAAKMRRSAPGRDATMDAESIASIFDLLEEGVSLADIVRRKRLHPDAVEGIAERWLRMKTVRFVLTRDDVHALMNAIGFRDIPVVGAFDELLDEIRKHRETLGASSQQASPDTKIIASTVAPSVGVIATLPEMLADLNAEERAVVLSDGGYVSFVEEQLADLKDGTLTYPEALASIRRAGRQSLRRARVLTKTGTSTTRRRPGS